MISVRWATLSRRGGKPAPHKLTRLVLLSKESPSPTPTTPVPAPSSMAVSPRQQPGEAASLCARKKVLRDSEALAAWHDEEKKGEGPQVPVV